MLRRKVLVPVVVVAVAVPKKLTRVVIPVVAAAALERRINIRKLYVVGV